MGVYHVDPSLFFRVPNNHTRPQTTTRPPPRSPLLIRADPQNPSHLAVTPEEEMTRDGNGLAAAAAGATEESSRRACSGCCRRSGSREGAPPPRRLLLRRRRKREAVAIDDMACDLCV